MTSGASQFEIYVGDGGSYAERAATLPSQPQQQREEGRYLADAGLVEAVNVALAVGLPLLLTGEPGCGKTRLAYSIAEELSIEGPHVFHTRSTSRAQDLLYRFDAVRRFYDIQIKDPRATDPSNYVEYGALGRAIRAPHRCVVLIDEIDKAPRDFPNDLLNELDRMEFMVQENPPGEQRQVATFRPIVVITSNTERQLPLPFLRRCIFYHVAFPTEAKLASIVRERLGSQRIDPNLISVAIDKFTAVREMKGISRQPGTSEFLSWLQALHIKRVDAQELKRGSLTDLPLWQALLKDRADHALLRTAV